MYILVMTVIVYSNSWLRNTQTF